MYAWQNWSEINPFKPKEVGCTLEAKICPDGSAVGRSGPNCEFAPCPSTISSPIASAQPQIPAGWKTYVNSTDFYTLGYPSDWIFGQESYEPERISLTKTDKTQSKISFLGATGYPKYTIWIAVRANPGYLSAKEYYQSNWTKSESGVEIRRQLEEIVISGEKAIRFDSDSEVSLNKMVLIAHKNRFYEISYEPISPDETFLKYYDEFDQILSTFRFD